MIDFPGIPTDDVVMAAVATTTSEIVAEHRKAMAELKKELNTPKKARAFLVRVGILTKSGKTLAKKYR